MEAMKYLLVLILLYPRPTTVVGCREAHLRHPTFSKVLLCVPDEVPRLPSEVAR
jgi:hypothetical protein